MFDHDDCQATDTCRNIPGHWMHVFSFAGETYDRPTWVQVCGFHVPSAGRIVSWIDNPRAANLRASRKLAKTAQ